MISTVPKTSNKPLLKVENLSVAFETRRGLVHVIEDLNFEVQAGRTLGIVGESGSGKSVTSLAIMGLLAPTAKVTSGQVHFDGQEILRASEGKLRDLRGVRIAMIFQDPMTSLNPSFTVGYQLMEAMRAHGIASRASDLEAKAAELLAQVGIPDPVDRLSAYPHQLSGGMSQRVMIAMAISCNPSLLIADEPTTALDVTIQAQILSLLKSLQLERQMGLILITHDIGVVAQMADDILVLYAGHAMELGSKESVIRKPCHPYTQALLASLPSTHGLGEFRSRLPTIAGLVPDLLKRPLGCQLHPRCESFDPALKCDSQVPLVKSDGERAIKCHLPFEAVLGPRSKDGNNPSAEMRSANNENSN